MMEVPRTEVDLTQEEIIEPDILTRIDDSLSAEKSWRERSQTIQEIYHGRLTAGGKATKTRSRFNSLNANVGVLLPALYSNPPKPEIESRNANPMPVENMVVQALQDTTSVFLEDTPHSDAFKNAIKERLIAGRGTVRVRWDPVMKTEPTIDPLTQAPQVDEFGNVVTTQRKVLDNLELEHVYWENYTQEAVSEWSKVGWVAFRHLYTETEFMDRFGDAMSVQQLVAEGKLQEIFKWTDQSARRISAKVPSRAQNQKNRLQDIKQKALVWEFWDKETREVIWICSDMEGKVLQVDEDILQLRNFFPCPKPLLAFTTTDNLIPTPEYEIYQDLAAEIDDISDRIAALVRRIKVRGAYNASYERLAEILKADDGEMLAVNGLDLEADLNKALLVVPNDDIIQSLQVLYQSRTEAKNAMYEVTGISDIVRGQTKASETLGAQRIKSQFASMRIEDRKTEVEEFCRASLELMVEIISEHFDAESIAFFSGKMLDEPALTILREDAMRISRIRIETDSTIAIDDAADQQAMSGMFQSLALVLQQLMPMVQGGIMPLPVAVEVVKMAIKPFRGHRKLELLLDAYMASMGMVPGATPPPPPPGAVTPGAPVDDPTLPVGRPEGITTVAQPGPLQ